MSCKRRFYLWRSNPTGVSSRYRRIAISEPGDYDPTCDFPKWLSLPDDSYHFNNISAAERTLKILRVKVML